MTKTEAAKLAKKQLSYGHFDHGTFISQRCPRCRQDIKAERLPWDKTTKTLRTALENHLLAGVDDGCLPEDQRAS